MKKALSVLLALAGALNVASAQEAKGDPAAGQKKNAMCIGCHGIAGYQASFPQVYKVPKIFGQNEAYLQAALTEYRKGARKHPTMRAIAGSLSDQDIADLAAYYAQTTDGEKPAPAQVQIPEDLQAKLAACVACHGANFNDTTAPVNPRLAGQYADYLRVALHSYKVETPYVGRKNATMGAMAAPLTDDDINRIADFLSGLPGHVEVIQHPRFR